VIDYLFRAPTRSAAAVRELQAARDIAHAFLTASRPSEVYHLALERVTPLVGAAFSCVFLQDSETGLLKIVAAHDWPVAHAAHLDSLRVRVGRGPTGRAVAENRVVEVFDVFADPALEDWWEVARELDFASSTSLPLSFAGRPIGAVTFYFRRPEALGEADRSLLRLVADQLAGAAEKAHLIDDLQEANAQLREQNEKLEARYRQADEAAQLKTEFLANVSHELRTPLTAVLGYTYLLREGVSGDLEAEQLHAVQKIENAATTLMWLINDLLDLTHLRLGRTTLELETCDAAALTRAALSTLDLPAAVRLLRDLPTGSVPVYSDPVHVLRILKSILSNAAKFTEEGEITVRLQLAERAGTAASSDERPDPLPLARWEIEDTGIGIAEEDHDRIFAAFQQVDGSATRRFGGTGLGLALSRELAHRLGGEISVRSRLGQGATFILELPATEAALGTIADARDDALSPEDITIR
jgi:signal transduction histidine kinase